MKKLLVVGVIVLFLGVSVIPSTGITDVKQITIPINSGNTLYVGGSGAGNYSKIQDAINDSSDRDTVFVYNGIYRERIIVNKSIELKGEEKDSTIIEMPGAGFHSAIIKVSALDVCINGFTINQLSGDGAGIWLTSNNSVIYDNNIFFANRGISLYNSNYSEISHNVIEAKNIGIGLTGWKDASNYNVIHNNTISVTGCPGYYVFGGIRVDYQSHNIIKDNYLFDCYNAGIEIYGEETYRPPGADNNTISDNIIESINITMEYGIHLAYNNWSDSNTVIGNTISKCELGILTSCDNNIISGNSIKNCNFGMYCGYAPDNQSIVNNTFEENNDSIIIAGGENITLKGNIFIKNRYGLTLEYCFSNIIQENEFRKNVVGVWLHHSSQNKIIMNNFINNLKSAFFRIGYNRWENNYWNRPISYPKPIIGRMGLFYGFIPWFQFDWHPAQEPYDIGV